MGGTVSGPGESYECAVCHGTFTRTRSDEEALAERRATWTEPFGDDECAFVCEDCFQRLIARVQREAPELLRRPER
jgi:hypothetical protein